MRRIYDSEETLEENYRILSRTTWSPDDTTTITWERQGRSAVGTFPSVRHAYLFINTHLNAARYPDRPVAFREDALVTGNQKTANRNVGIEFQDSANLPIEMDKPVSVPIDLATLNTPALREIIDSEVENHNMIAQNDRRFELLSKMHWSGICTKKIEWRRSGQMAIGRFGFCEDASGFVHGYLGRSVFNRSGFLQIETESSIRDRGRVRERFLWMDSRADEIEIPREAWGGPVEISIPLRYLDMEGLRERYTVPLYPSEVKEIQEGPDTPLVDRNKGPA